MAIPSRPAGGTVLPPGAGSANRPVRPLVVETSPLLGALLHLAFAERGLSRDALALRWPSGDEGGRPVPSAIFIQQGGMRALQRLGVDTGSLAARGVAVTSVVLLDRAATPLLAYAPALPSSGPDPVWVPSEALRQVLAKTAAAAGLAPKSQAPAERRDSEWTGTECPGILLRRLPGRVRRPGTHVIWDAPGAHVGLTQLPEETIFCYAVPRAAGPKDEELRVCRGVLDELPRRLGAHLAEVASAPRDEWFPLDRVGYRACREGDVLHWGSNSLRLHPLTGQHISYWAIQAIGVAADVARHGTVSAAVYDRLDREARRIYRRHLRSMAFYLRQTPVWRVLFHPYARALRHSAFLRRQAVTRIALLDLG